MTDDPTQKSSSPALKTPIGRLTVMLCGVCFIVDGILAIVLLGYWSGPRLTKRVLDRASK